MLHNLARYVPKAEEDIDKYKKTMGTLLKEGADLYILNFENKNPLYIAQNSNNTWFGGCVGLFEAEQLKKKKKSRQHFTMKLTIFSSLGTGMGCAIIVACFVTPTVGMITVASVGGILVGALLGAIVGYGIMKFHKKENERKSENPCTLHTIKVSEEFKSREEAKA
ncbi:hypothetical protein [Wolbachia endosymbiont of Pentidionis agamae]|uniref:hypothetical protein n=1 Tax=Wolbachia endosymbiont of Pentidionis agamae TaxID=3110435 RepID=UPI002FD23662